MTFCLPKPAFRRLVFDSTTVAIWQSRHPWFWRMRTLPFEIFPSCLVTHCMNSSWWCHLSSFINLQALWISFLAVSIALANLNAFSKVRSAYARSFHCKREFLQPHTNWSCSISCRVSPNSQCSERFFNSAMNCSTVSDFCTRIWNLNLCTILEGEDWNQFC